VKEIGKIVKKRIFEEVVIAIKDKIKDGIYKPGDRLPSEEEMSKYFDVSKTVIREAMSVLKSNGLIESRPGLGTFLRQAPGSSAVTPIISMLLLTEFPLVEILELRRGLEVEAASLAAERATDEEISVLMKKNDAMLEAIQNGRLAIEEDYGFHKAIFYATHNSALIKVFNSISSVLKEGISVSKIQSSDIPGRHMEGCVEHLEIIQAISERDSKKGRQTMRKHLYNNETKTWNLDRTQ
jgi:GntR family transcriptional repressor for pyruvate dehydrogenase complex